jgi:hypothetical protein
MNGKLKEYSYIALIIVISLTAFYAGKFAVTSIFDYYKNRNEKVSQLADVNITKGDFEDGVNFLRSHPNTKDSSINSCVAGFNEEARKRNTAGVYSESAVKSYCECAINEVIAGSSFDNAVKKCVDEKLVR